MQTWFDGLPAAARALFIGLLSSAAIFGMLSLYAFADVLGESHESVVGRLVLSTIIGLLTGVVGVVFGDQRMRRVYGSTDRARTYSRALRSGELPAQIDPAAWQRWLAVSAKTNRWAPASVAMFMVFGLLQGLGKNWFLVALFGAFAIWQAAVALVMRRRIARLTAAVRRRAEEQSLGLP